MSNDRLAHTRVGVLGSGEVGRRLAAGFASRGRYVMIGSREPGKPELSEWLAGDGPGIKAGTFAETAARSSSAGSKAPESSRRSASCASRSAVDADRGTTGSSCWPARSGGAARRS